MGANPFRTNLEAEVREEARRRAAGEDRILSVTEHQELLDQAVSEARDAAFEEGRAKGESEARESILAKVSASVAEIAPQVEAILARTAEHQDHLERQLTGFALAVAEKVAPDVVRLRSKANVLDGIKGILALTLAQPKIVVTVSPAVRAAMGEDLEAVAAQLGHKGALEVAEDAELSDGAARVVWDNGFMEYSFDRVCEQILAALSAAAQNASPST